MAPIPAPTAPYFYPRSPCGERRAPSPPRREFYKISIHALLAESDRQFPLTRQRSRYFYPRSPCGERQRLRWRCSAPFAFLSTLSLRRATWNGVPRHADDKFLSTLSLRRATSANGVVLLMLVAFLSTLSLRRATMWPWSPLNNDLHFYPRSPCGERH